VYGFGLKASSIEANLIKTIDFSSRSREDSNHPVTVFADEIEHVIDTPYRAALFKYSRVNRGELHRLFDHLNRVEADQAKSGIQYGLSPVIVFDLELDEFSLIPKCVYHFNSSTERKQIKILLLDLFDQSVQAQTLADTDDSILRVAEMYRQFRDGHYVDLSIINRSFDYATIDEEQMMKDFDVIRFIEGRDCIRKFQSIDVYVFIP